MKGPESNAEFPRTVVILFASEAIGGAERYLIELAIGMQGTSAKPVVVNLKRFVPYRAQLEDHGIPVHAGVAHQRLDPLGALRLYRLLRKLSPDALLVNANRQAMRIVPPVAKLARVPVTLIHTHDHLHKYQGTLRFAARISEGVVGAAEAHARHLVEERGLPARRVSFVYPGIDMARTKPQSSPGTNPAPRPNPVVGIVAALRPEKDHETFLRAVAIAHERVSEARFDVIGDGERRPGLEALARELGVADAVRFRGWQTVDASLLGHLDMLVLSSASETFPAVILEAFGTGLPVVSTNVGAIEELVGEPPAAVLVPPGDPKALAAAMVRVLEDPTLAADLARRGGERVTYFQADRFAGDMLALFRRVRNAGTRMDA
jgi:glycosyltransferase involved in cell wall biosynthesis